MTTFATRSLLLLFLAAAASGQEAVRAGRLQVMLTPDSPLGRTDAPRWVHVKTVWDGGGLLEGRLDLEIRDHHSSLGRFLGGELVLPGGEQDFRVMLPGLRRHYGYGECEALIRFARPGGNVEKLGTEPYRIGDQHTRVISLAASRPNKGGDETWLRFVNSLRLDRFNPKRDAKTLPRLRSSVAHLAREDFPVRPHGYLAYDLAVFSDKAFPALSGAQLEALGAWVAAGGSACILCAPELPPAHRRFLSRVAGRAGGGTDSGVGSAGKARYLTYGLGRIAIAEPAVLQRNADGIGRRRMAAFLWKAREAQVRTIVRDGKWGRDQARRTGRRYHWGWTGSSPILNRQGRLPLHPLMPPGGYDFARHLLPKSVRVVPLSIIVLLLFLLVVSIGPMEYWLLGLVRARPLTWVVFPATCLLFTWVIVAAGNYYIGKKDHTRVLRIIDTDSSGRSLRENRLELIFAAKNRRWERSLRNAVFATMDANRFVRRGDHYAPHFAGDTETLPPVHRGRYPERYAVNTALKQWRPALTRQLLIGIGETTPWKLPQEPRFGGKDGSEGTLKTFLEANLGFDGGVYLIGEGRVFALKAAPPFGTGELPHLVPPYDPSRRGYCPTHVVPAIEEETDSSVRSMADRAESVIEDVLALTDLTDKRDARVDGLSRGMKQRLGLARVLLHDPDLLLLDEPASGLDPRARIEIRELLKELRSMGKTVLISSHILHELSELCTCIGIVEAGKMVAEGSLSDIYDQLGVRRTVHVQVKDPGEDLARDIGAIEGVDSVERQVDRFAISIDEQKLSATELHDRIHALGARIFMFQPEAMDMETVFMKLTEGKTA